MTEIERLRTIRDQAEARMHSAASEAEEYAERFTKDPSVYDEWQRKKQESLNATATFERANTAYLDAVRRGSA